MVSAIQKRRKISSASAGGAKKIKGTADSVVLPQGAPVQALVDGQDKLIANLGQEGTLEALDHIWAILSEEGELRDGFIADSQRLFDCLVAFFARCPDISTISRLSLVLGSYFSALPDPPVRDVASPILNHICLLLLPGPVASEADQIPIFQLFELLVEDMDEAGGAVDQQYREHLIAFAKKPLESSLCVVHYLISQASESDLVQIADSLRHNACNMGASEQYLGKCFRVLANLAHVPLTASLATDLLVELFGGRLASLSDSSADVTVSLGVLLANLLENLADEAISRLAGILEDTLSSLKRLVEDSDDVFDVYCLLMASLSNTGMWASDASDILAIAREWPDRISDSIEHLAVVCFYCLVHSQGSPDQLGQVRLLLESNAHCHAAQRALNGLK